jgi:hypothetical protein
LLYQALLQWIRPSTVEARRAERLFRAEALRIASQLRKILDSWSSVREIEPENDRLANAAAVNRWELMRLAQDAEQLQAPRPLSGAHRELCEAVTSSARACQLLANGYRFHKSEAVCDGQALLLDTLASLDRLHQQLQR